jgi:hypothetical protein
MTQRQLARLARWYLLLVVAPELAMLAGRPRK